VPGKFAYTSRDFLTGPAICVLDIVLDILLFLLTENHDCEFAAAQAAIPRKQ
jgi:hypothetical protein